jgi:uncharacterized RDD family membrane protein YckC
VNRYAGLVTRFVGLLVDLAALTLAVPVVTSLPVTAYREVIGPVPGWVPVLTAAVGGLLPWGYFTVGWWLGGRTLGGVLVGTVLRRRDGRPVGLGRALVRAGLGLLLWPVWLAGLLAILWDPYRRAWHDRLLGTVVEYRA